ncbi:hypothetical protein [Microcoleus sp. FACHB-672]|uniref:hypothetical protein n=1 Tax=Microcoleus sp. FACHB-672 TaxID=2692825 RepID=UPI001688E229|nr:hypothetical protein [Microcoleus sp. FACHB-672]MBD2040245.1 hypothetical protein [Microcoleus sp. FACHB-672]
MSFVWESGLLNGRLLSLNIYALWPPALNFSVSSFSPSLTISTCAGSDTIADFTDGEDLLGLSAGLTFENLTITAGNNATLILAGDELLVTLIGVQPSLITVNDFVQV